MRLAPDCPRPPASAFDESAARDCAVLARHRGRMLAAVLLLACGTPAFAGADEGPAAAPPREAALPTLAGASPVDGAGEPSPWTVALGAVAFTRTSGTSRVLVTRLPGATTTFGQTLSMAGTEAFSSNAFERGYAAGPTATLTWRADPQLAFELSYLGVSGLEAAHTAGPENPVYWYVMRAPGFWQTQDFYYQGMTWTAKSDLRSLEANARSTVANRVEVLAGLRWLRLKDSLVGSLTPPDTNEPAWKVGGCATDSSDVAMATSVATMTLPGTAQACAAGEAVGGYPPFWTTSTTNNLLGVQAGAEGTLAAAGPLSLVANARAGVYFNRAAQDAAVSMKKEMYYASARRNRLAYSGQAGIEARYALGTNVSAKVGYTVLWLGGVALAPDQIDRTASTSNPAGVTATGVDTGASLVLQGFTATVLLSF